MNWQYTAAVRATKEWTVTYFSPSTTPPIVSLCFDETYTPNEAKKIHLPPHLSTTADAATFSLPLIPLRCNMQSFMFTLEPTAIRTVQLFLSKQPNENSDGAVLLALHVHSTLYLLCCIQIWYICMLFLSWVLHSIFVFVVMMTNIIHYCLLIKLHSKYSCFTFAVWHIKFVWPSPSPVLHFSL